MKELIWFSIPGSILVAVVYLLMPPSFHDSFLWLMLAPLFGFIINQSYRVYFEWHGDLSGDWRETLQTIRTIYGIIDDPNRKAHLIWEMTVYSDKIPEVVRQSNRETWHFIIAMRTCFWSTLFSLSILYIGFFFGSNGSSRILNKDNLIIFTTIYILASIIFFAKAKLTTNDLVRREKALIKIYSKEFDFFATKIMFEKKPVILREATNDDIEARVKLDIDLKINRTESDNH